MPSQAREDVDMTSLIKNILDNYPAGSATLREFLQNTDDSGATYQRFILDTRTFSTDHLVHSALTRCQGPAIIAVNDGHFEDKDWKAIMKINASSKAADESSTGKYGLGFRSCYHVTDNPHILSGEQLLILDPHQRVPKFPGGLALETKGDDRVKHASHFDGFRAVFTNEETYDGTAIRLPLRTEEYAKESRIKTSATTVEGARRMFEDFIAKELKEAMLFLKHIEVIELSVIEFSEVDPNGKETLLARAVVEDQDAMRSQRSLNRGRESETSHYTLNIRVEEEMLETSYRWLVLHHVEDYQKAVQSMASRLGRDVADDMLADKLFPHVALAFPLAGPQHKASSFSGRLFTLLPLPIITRFPAHVNAVLALTSSRQNLKNAVDITPGSREEFLVEWNKLIFADFVPQAWVAALEVLTRDQPDDVWWAWPSVPDTAEGDSAYWYQLPTQLLEFAVSRPIWRSSVGTRLTRFQCLSEILVVADTDKITPVDELSEYSIGVARVPSSVFAILTKSSDHQSRILTPRAVYPYLKANSRNMDKLDSSVAAALRNYLTSAKELSLLMDLPLVPTTKGGLTTIYASKRYILATDVEGKVFKGADSQFLASDLMSAETRKILLTAPEKRISTLRPAHVAQFLKQLFGRFPSVPTVTNGVAEDDIHRLLNFWSWLSKWSKNDLNSLLEESFFSNQISHLHLLPLASTTTTSGRLLLQLRQCGQAAIKSQGLDEPLRNALQDLGLPIIHDQAAFNATISSRVTRASSDIHYFLSEVKKAQQHKPFEDLSAQAKKMLHDHLNHNLDKVQLNPAEQETLRLLPIFPIVRPGPRNSEQVLDYEPAPPAMAHFIRDDVEVVPNIHGKTFIDFSQASSLHKALGGKKTNAVLTELECLHLAIQGENWSQQEAVPGLPALLMDRILRRLGDLGRETRQIVSRLPIVNTGAASLLPPSDVVDPASSIAQLFDPEDHVLPIGDFARDTPGSYLQQLRLYEMLQQQLSHSMVKDIVLKLGNHARAVRDRADKAQQLLHLLDKWTQTQSLTRELATTIRSQPWIPLQDSFCRPSECWRDHYSSADLCDLVKPLVRCNVQSMGLLRALGWDIVPFEIVKRQFIAVVESDEDQITSLPQGNLRRKSKVDRISAILKELGSRFKSQQCSDTELQSLADSLGDQAWVPISSSARAPAHRTMLETSGTGHRFYQVYTGILTDAVSAVLRAMGINRKPDTEMLCIELHLMSNEMDSQQEEGPASDDSVDAAISILDSISRDEKWMRTAENRARILVPTDSARLQTIGSIIFNDLPHVSPEPPSDSYFAHPSVPPSLAIRLKLRRWSEEEFSKDEDEVDTFDMGEELHVRIQGVLKDYDVNYSSNEWVANAQDANALNVKFIIDEATHSGYRLVSPSLQGFHSLPSLVVYNDGVFTEKDFKGLASIGQGGKGDDPEAIGRFGLGALSFFHFTEVPMLVSADSVLFLDPSLRYLPRAKGGGGRSGIRMTLDLCRMRYPDQLKPLYGMCGFDEKSTYYQGTLFRLPLRSPDQAEKSKLSNTSFSAIEISNLVERFYNSASQSLYFSKLQSIIAERRRPNGDISPMWSVQLGSRESANKVRVDLEHTSLVEVKVLLEATTGTKYEESWLVASSQVQSASFPEELQDIFARNRVRNPTAGIALNVFGTTSVSDSRLFATLPLPVPTSLPVHLHASWIMARDRRSLRYEPPDAQGQRTSDACYNEYLLANVFPPLYLMVLGAVASQYPAQLGSCWPRNRSDDAISRTLADALYRSLPGTSRLVFRSVTSRLLAPKDAILHTHRPAALRRLFVGLKIDYFVGDLPFEAGCIEGIEGLRTDSPGEVANTMRSHSEEVAGLFHVQSNRPDKLPLLDIDVLLQYLIKGEADLRGVPLLQRADGAVIPFAGPEGDKVFVFERYSPQDVFGRHNVVGQDIPRSTIDDLLKLPVNVRKLDADGLRELLARSPHRITPSQVRSIDQTYADFSRQVLAFLAEGHAGFALENFNDLPLIPTTLGGVSVAISLGRAQEEDVWWEAHLGDDVILPILTHLGLPVVDLPRAAAYRTHDVSLKKVLEILHSVITLLPQAPNDMPETQWQSFVHWIVASLGVHPTIHQLLAPELNVLEILPLFEAFGPEGRIPFASCSVLHMLPAGLTLNDIHSLRTWMPDHLILSPYSFALHGLLGRRHAARRLALEDLPRRLVLPETLSQHQEEGYLRIIDIIIRHAGTYAEDVAFVPDETQRLRTASQLYDHRVDLFRICLPNRPHLFVHPRFIGFVDGLIQAGLRNTVSGSDLLACIRAVDQDARNGLDTRARALTLWEYINDQGIQASRSVPFATIANLRFIPAHPRRRASDQELEEFAVARPNIVSPSEIYVQEHAHILWTQRVSPQSEPSDLLRAVYRDLGSPTPVDVVNHLVTLATEAAPAHPQHPSLLLDTRKTYQWLKEHDDAATRNLLRERAQSPIWLNVENPKADHWEWRPAETLVFGLRYDRPGDRHFYDVRQYLETYKELLLAVGANEYSYPALEVVPVDQPTHTEQLRAGWAYLRENNALVDIHFQVEGELIPAHRAILAAAVPHFMDALTGDFRESRLMSQGENIAVYPLPDNTSVFAVKNVIDYAYTGEFVSPQCETTEDAELTLRNLLDLMELSNYLQMHQLKAESVKAIVDLKLVRVENCDHIMQRARECGVEALARVCEETKDRNQWA